MRAMNGNQPPCAIVTGASAGIGRATAIEFGRRGYGVALAARRSERLMALAEEIARAGGLALPIVADVTVEADRERLVEDALTRFGRIDVLVNNAGAGFTGTIEETSPEIMRELFELNYMSAFELTRVVLPVMRRQRSGHIVNVASVVGKMAFPLHGAYAASKFAMVAMTEALRGELAGSGITASVVLPASTRTEFFEVQRARSPRHDTVRAPMQSAEHVARAIVASVRRPRPEVNPMPPLRLAYGLNAFFPALRDIAGRVFYQRTMARRAATSEPPAAGRVQEPE